MSGSMGSKIKSGSAGLPTTSTSHPQALKQLVKCQPVATWNRTTFCMWHRQLVVVVQQLKPAGSAQNVLLPTALVSCF